MSRPATKESFIDKFSKIYPNLDFSKVVYINSYTPVELSCIKHGSFMKVPRHLNGSGCPACGFKKRDDSHKGNYDDFIDFATKAHGNKYGYDKSSYDGLTKPMRIFCKKHGWFNQTPFYHRRGHGCIDCKYDSVGAMLSKTFDDFVRESRFIHGDKFEYDEKSYNRSTSKTRIKCPDHGWFWQTASRHSRGASCRKCHCGGFRKSEFINKSLAKYNGLATLYLIKFELNDEVFYKIGITMRSIKKRFKAGSTPYSYEVVSTIISHAGTIWSMEKESHAKSTKFHYTPKLKFGGSARECFTRAYFNGLWYES